MSGAPQKRIGFPARWASSIALRTAEKSLSFPLLVSKAGGKGGGGAALSPEGRQFLNAYRAFEQTVRDYADEVFEDMFGQME